MHNILPQEPGRARVAGTSANLLSSPTILLETDNGSISLTLREAELLIVKLSQAVQSLGGGDSPPRNSSSFEA